MASQLRVDKIEPVDGVPTGGAGGIIQCVQSVRTSTYAQDLATQTDTGEVMQATITPKFATSKIMVWVHACLGFANDGDCSITLVRGGSIITAATGDASGNKTRVSATGHTDATARQFNISTMFLDSPASTSALTYGVKLRHAENGTTWIYLNRNHNDTDSDLTLRATSSLTLMELSA